MYYKCHKVNSKHGGLYIDSPDWIKKKNVTTNKIWMINVFNTQQLLHYEEIESHPERVSNIKLFINKYDWEGIDDQKMFEKYNLTIALNILHTKEK